jgi:hypothetical protein
MQNTTENNRITSRAQNATEFQPSVFLTGIRRLLVGFQQSKLSRSDANSSVIISTLLVYNFYFQFFALSASCWDCHSYGSVLSPFLLATELILPLYVSSGVDFIQRDLFYLPT